ncbi:hypothetical protein EDD86DRAFT_259894 [Gorgonomyces haynaldii]|nr:hypothetical protein EDD86DRAFT_259894 [Gorgonomyces haynaldii]
MRKACLWPSLSFDVMPDWSPLRIFASGASVLSALISLVVLCLLCFGVIAKNTQMRLLLISLPLVNLIMQSVGFYCANFAYSLKNQNLTFLIGMVYLALIFVTNCATLRLFYVLDERLTKKRINIFMYISLVVVLLLNALHIYVWIRGSEQIDTTQNLADSLSSLSGTYMIAFDNICGFYLLYIVKQKIGDKHAEVKDGICDGAMRNLCVVSLDWIGLGVFAYQILTIPPDQDCLQLIVTATNGYHSSGSCLIYWGLETIISKTRKRKTTPRAGQDNAVKDVETKTQLQIKP